MPQGRATTLTRPRITPRRCFANSRGKAIPAAVQHCAAGPVSAPWHCAACPRTANTPRPRRGAGETLEYFLRAYAGPRRDVRPAGSDIPVAVSPVRPSPPLPHYARRCGDIQALLGRTKTRHRHNGHCATYGLPVNGTLELARHGGRSTNYYAAALEAAPVRAQDTPRRLNGSWIRQDARQLCSTVRHTATRRRVVWHACKQLPPWPIKGGAAPNRGDGGRRTKITRSLSAFATILALTSITTSGTWRTRLLSRLACSHPSTGTTVRVIQCPEHTTAGRTAQAGTSINPVSLVA
jgi:hypothetical protein